MITRCEQIIAKYSKQSNPCDTEHKPKSLGKGFDEILAKEMKAIEKGEKK